jgi:hypothetical protein
MDHVRFPVLIRSVYAAVDELERMFPGRHFIPDGHMVGSIGEALAAYYYGLKLFAASAEAHDGTVGNRLVQVKATQTRTISISSEPEFLLVLRIARDGSFEEIYNGPGAPVWTLVSHKPRPKNGQYQVALSKLTKLMPSIPVSERILRTQGS